MFQLHKRTAPRFIDVAMFFIVMGALVFAVGVIGWLWAVSTGEALFFFPAAKVIGGAVIMALGYIQLELELIRKR